MNELLSASGEVIACWLEKKLPALGTKWWVDNVLNRLTFQQQRLVDERHTQSLAGLDLAAVLRVLDQNWSELAGAKPLPREARNWVKEFQSVRNRWAHAPAGGLSPTDTFHDADTLERLLRIFNADDALLSQISALKQATLAKMTPSPRESAASPGLAAAASPNPSSTPVPTPKFAVGQLLCLHSNPSSVFPVLEALPGAGTETRYRVFESGAKQVYYESQLRALDEPADTPAQSGQDDANLGKMIEVLGKSAAAHHQVVLAAERIPAEVDLGGFTTVSLVEKRSALSLEAYAEASERLMGPLSALRESVKLRLDAS